MASDQWIGITEAAEKLGLHPSTLRRWADAGRIPSRRTLSGRRRFERSAIENLHLEKDYEKPTGPANNLEASMQDFTSIHTKALAIREQGLKMRLNEEQTLFFRYSGQSMMSLLMHYISRNNNAENFLEEAKKIAREYGLVLARAGVPASQAAEFYLDFRRSILASMLATTGLAGQNDRDGQDILIRLSDFFDALLIATIESHASISRPQ